MHTATVKLHSCITEKFLIVFTRNYDRQGCAGSISDKFESLTAE